MSSTILLTVAIAVLLSFAFATLIGASKEMRIFGRPTSFVKDFIEGPYLYFTGLVMLVWMSLFAAQFMLTPEKYHGFIAFDFLPLLILSFYIARILALFCLQKLSSKKMV